MQKLFLFFTCAYLLFSCAGTSECDCAELYQQKDSLYYFPSYGDKKTNKLVAQYFNAENKIAQLKYIKDSLEQSSEASTSGLTVFRGDGANYHDSVRILLAEIKSQHIQEPDTSLIKKHLRLSGYYSQDGNFENALQSSLNALQLAEKTGMRKFMISAYMLIGDLYLWKHEYAKSLGYAMRALKIAEQEGKLQKIFSGHMLISRIYLFNNDMERSRLYFDQAKKIQSKIKTSDSRFYIEMHEIDLHIHNGNFNKGIQLATSMYEREFASLRPDYQLVLLHRLYDFIKSNKPVKYEKEILQKLIELEPGNENYKTGLRIAKGEISEEEGRHLMVVSDSVRAKENAERMIKSENLQKEKELALLKIDHKIMRNELERAHALMELRRMRIRPDRRDGSVYTGICRSGNKEIEFGSGKRKSSK